MFSKTLINNIPNKIKNCINTLKHMKNRSRLPLLMKIEIILLKKKQLKIYNYKMNFNIFISKIQSNRINKLNNKFKFNNNHNKNKRKTNKFKMN